VRGVVFDVQRYSVHDGPGLRTNVFLKGCPLHCEWCANPESQNPRPEPMLRQSQCIECGLFAEPCSTCWPQWMAQKRGPALVEEIDLRTSICPTGALGWVGAWRTADEVMREVLRDRPFYGEGGGLTITGGEPTMQPAFCSALLTLARAAGIATAMETSGHAPWEVFELLAPLIDLFLYDVKHMDSEIHRRHTGVDNGRILENLRRLSAHGAGIRVRVPLIPGFNADGESVAAIARFVRGLPGEVQGVDLLPYHSMGRAKYEALGREYLWPQVARLTDVELSRLKSVVEDAGLPATIGG
jgi:pyruvate formate lyase activating enzyme